MRPILLLVLEALRQSILNFLPVGFLSRPIVDRGTIAASLLAAPVSDSYTLDCTAVGPDVITMVHESITIHVIVTLTRQQKSFGNYLCN